MQEPFKITFRVASEAMNFAGSHFKGKVSLFFMGARGTGKTSFRKTLQYMSIEAIRDTKKSTLLERTSTNFSFDDGRFLSLICYDFGGDDIYRDERHQAVINNAPLAILFFIDQRDILKEIPKYLRYTNDRIAIKEWEVQDRDRLAGFDETRIEEHYKQFDDLCSLIQNNLILKKYTRLVIPIVTKYDIWRGKLGLEDFDALFAKKIRELGRLDREVLPFMAASPVEYIGTPEIMNEVFKRSGREYKFLGWTWRWHQKR